MTPAAALLGDAFHRVDDSVQSVLDGLTSEDLGRRITPDANSIGWLVWHLLRVQDELVAGAGGTEPVWIADGWHERLDLPFEPRSTGYGHSSADVAAVRTSPELLTGYGRAVAAVTSAYLATLADADLDRVVDESYDPPVTLGVRLVSVVEDVLKHVGQAEYLAGLPD